MHELLIGIIPVGKRKHWWTDLELTLQFFLNPLSYMSEGDLPLPQHGTHMKVQPGRHPETVPERERLSPWCIMSKETKPAVCAEFLDGN